MSDKPIAGISAALLGASAAIATRAIAVPFLPARRLRSSIACLGRDQLDLGAFAQLVGPIDDHVVSDVDAGFNRCGLALNGPELDRRDAHRVIGLYDVDEGSRRAALNLSVRSIQS